MEDRDWKILHVLYEQKNITKTAHALYISQPALTSRLRQIEEEFGAKIVSRTSKGVQFTPQGEYLAKSATEVLLKLRHIKEYVQGMNDTVSGTLRLGASSYSTTYILPHLLSLFKKQYPDVEFGVTTTWNRDVFNLVHNQQVHIGFISSDYGWQSGKHLLFEEPVCVASMEEICIRNLPALPRINYLTDPLIKASIDRWWRENFSQPSSISMEVDKLATCKEMVKSGLGYAIMPFMLLNDVKNIHRQILTDKEGNPVMRRSWMIYHEESLEINLIKTFVNFVKKIDFRRLYQLPENVSGKTETSLSGNQDC